MQKSFSFKGITRNSDNLLVADGECMELVNCRVKDGCLEPFSPHFDETELEHCYEKVYWHSAADVFLCIEYKYEGKVHFYDKDYRIMKQEGSDSLELFPELKWVERVEFVGFIACLVAKDTTYYIFFDSGKYRWLGEKPALPEFSFSCESDVFEVKTDEEYEAGISLRDEDSASRWGNVSKGYFDQCLSMLHSHGYYVDRALFRCALRLFDGNYFCYSPIFYVDDDAVVGELGRDGNNFQAKPLTAGSVKSKYAVRVQGFLPSFHLKELNLADWENVIVGIDIFTTGSIYGHKIIGSEERLLRRNGAYYSKDYGIEHYVEKEGEEIVNDVRDAATFYKIAEYNIQGVLIDAVKDVSATNLALCDTLPDDVGSMVNRSAAYTCFFNGRLHLAGVREMFMKGYSHSDYVPVGGETVCADYATVVTRIKSSMGISVVKKVFDGNFTLGSKDGVLALSPYIMYPDARAFEVEFMITSAGLTYRKAFPLQQHKSLNLAHYVNSAGSLFGVSLECHLTVTTEPSSYSKSNILAYFSYVPGVYEIKYVADDGWYYGDEPFLLRNGSGYNRYSRMISVFNPQPGDTIIITIKREQEVSDVTGIEDIPIDDTWEVLDAPVEVAEENPCEVRGNVLKVSAVDNPFFFAAKNTYTPTKEDIIAVSSNTVALSQGQFGKHPLFVFGKDGIWAMEGDASGGVTYAASHPVSREVCINASSLCCIDSGIVFLSTRGVMLLQGSALNCISDAIDADSHFMQNVAVKDIFYRIAMLAENQYALSLESFSRYISGDVAVGYISEENEVWVSNPAYYYSYIYSLNSGTWSKISIGITAFINCYPRQLYLRLVDDKSYIAVIDKKTALPHSPITLFTRPQLWGTKLPKRIMQFMLHACVKIIDTGSAFVPGRVGCYLLCSNDGVHFKLVTGAERVKDFSDIVFPFFPTQAYKYFVIALSGVVAAESRIVGAELSLVAGWDNRMR